ncbi:MULTISPECIES: hypothetical protein [unclassified Acinetobacter]|uniref:hypothetical protein n=1 Tax=unclassified Acinetobacter TaxID=196816 RepID=UPI0035BAAF0D
MSVKFMNITVLGLSLGLLSGCTTTATPSKVEQPTSATSVANQINVEQRQRITGNISGYDVEKYQFYGKKGQLLRVVRQDTSQKIELGLEYLGKGVGSATDSLAGDYQILPYTGEYQLIIGQTRNDARKSNAPINYNLTAYISDLHQPQGVADMTYQCDNNQTLSVNYTGNMATASFNNQIEKMVLNRNYGGGDNLVYANKNYMLSITTPSERNFTQSMVNSLNSLKTDANGVVILQNCQVK